MLKLCQFGHCEGFEGGVFRVCLPSNISLVSSVAPLRGFFFFFFTLPAFCLGGEVVLHTRWKEIMSTRTFSERLGPIFPLISSKR